MVFFLALFIIITKLKIERKKKKDKAMYFHVSYQLWKPIIGFATLAIFKYLYKKI